MVIELSSFGFTKFRIIQRRKIHETKQVYIYININYLWNPLGIHHWIVNCCCMAIESGFHGIIFCLLAQVGALQMVSNSNLNTNFPRN